VLRYCLHRSAWWLTPALISLAGSACAPPAATDDDEGAEEALTPARGSPKTIRLAGGLEEWMNDVQAKVKSDRALERRGYTECVSLEELDGTTLCLSSHVKRMNEAFTRATIFTEGTQETPRGTVVSTKSDAFAQGFLGFVGHDLRSEHLLGFWSAIGKSCEKEKVCPSVAEKQLFEETVLPLAKRSSTFVVIAFALDTGDPKGTVTHEVLHAQYFLTPGFAETTDRFWTEEVAAADKPLIEEALRPHYDVTDGSLLRNEFQAYMLMGGAEGALLGEWVAKYRSGMLAALRTKSLAPLDVR
jgi:hypothetical protein